MENLTRRDFQKNVLGTILASTLLQSLWERGALADGVKPIMEKWLKETQDLCASVRDRKIAQVDWQMHVEDLFRHVELGELLTLIDFEKLTANLAFRDQGERSLKFELPAVEGVPATLAYGKQIFALSKGRSVIPHGHNNMATAFLVLKGEFRGRLYDRVEDTPTHMIIRPTTDMAYSAGSASTISDQKDNVHWFETTSETAFIYNIHVRFATPNPQRPGSGRVYVDPNGEKLAGGLIRAPLLKPADAYKLYG